jgi:hypothetical protein
MAITGPTPKPADKRARTNPPTFETTELAGGKVAAPRLVGRKKLCPEARRWWDVWAKSPQAGQFLATDWLHLEVLVHLVDDFYRADDAKARTTLAATILRVQSKLGATPEDRLRLRWRLSESAGAEERGEKKAAKTKRRRTDPRLEMIDGGKS